MTPGNCRFTFKFFSHFFLLLLFPNVMWVKLCSWESAQMPDQHFLILKLRKSPIHFDGLLFVIIPVGIHPHPHPLIQIQIQITDNQ